MFWYTFSMYIVIKYVKMKYLFLIFALCFTVLVNAQDTTNVKVEAPKIVNQLQLGNSITHDDITINFVKVIRDSRCPKNVNCIRAGEAEVLIRIFEKGEKSEEKVVKLLANNQLSTLFLSNDLKISAYNLLPYPDGVGNVADVDYSLELTFKDVTEKGKN